jgi:O-antigen/teichoic acid export membrane protein
MDLFQGKNSKILKGTFFYSLRQIVVTVLQFLTNILILKWLNPNEFGNYSIISLVIGLTQIIAEGGLGVYLVQRQKEITSKDLSEIVSFQLVVYSVIHFVVFIAYLFFNNSLLLYVFIILFVIPFTIFRSSNYIYLEKAFSFEKISFVEVSETFLYSISIIIFAFFGLGVWSFIFGALVKSIAGYLIIKNYKNWHFEFIFSRNLSKLKNAISFGLSYHTPTIINYIRISANPIIIGPILGLAAVGIADRAIFFAGLPLYFIGAVQQKIFFPYFSSIQDSKEKIKSNFEYLYYLSSIVDKLFYLPLIILAPVFIIIYFEKWIETIPLFYIAIVGNVVFGSLSFSSFPVLNGIGKTKIIAISSIISVLISWILLSPLINFFGLNGYAILGVVIWIVGFFPGYTLLVKNIPNLSLFRSFYIPLISFLIPLLTVFVIDYYFEFNIFQYFLLTFISLILYVLILFKFDKNIFKVVYTMFIKRIFMK